MPVQRFQRFVGVLLLLNSTTLLRADTWPQWRGEKSDGIWRETGLIDSFPADGLQRKWSAPIGPGYCGPTVTEEKVYLMDRGLESDSEEERVLCFDRHTGEPVWTFAYSSVYEGVAYDAGPRASVTLSRGTAFSLGTMGHLHALDAETGEVLWKRNLVEEFRAEVPTWGVSAAPLVINGRVIVQSGGTAGPAALALDAETGEELWRGPADRMSYSAPTIPPAAPGTVIVWSDSYLRSFSIGDGKVIWEVESPKVRPFASRVQSPVFNRTGDSFLLSDFNDGTRRFDLEDKTWNEAWHVRGKNERNTEGLHSLIGSPAWIDDHFYGIDSYGSLIGLKASDSSRVWKTDSVVPLSRWSTAFIIREGEQGNRVWMLNEVGEFILAELTPEGFQEMDRTQLIAGTQEVKQREHLIVWSHPAFAHRHVYARNDRELIAVSLAADGVNGRTE